MASTLQSILISPTLTSLSDQNIIYCFLCGQHFKTPGGLAWQNTIIKKYNQSSKIVRIPKKEFNAPAVEESKIDIDPLLQLVAKKPQKQYRKPKFTYGEVLIE
ncbi:6235_t:CDS:2 [Gigaspora rosea]|nr:6235_t:CDS:2 [Gigaspora rosea]